jgi:hypothetical protein
MFVKGLDRLWAEKMPYTHMRPAQEDAFGLADAARLPVTACSCSAELVVASHRCAVSALLIYACGPRAGLLMGSSRCR